MRTHLSSLQWNYSLFEVSFSCRLYWFQHLLAAEPPNTGTVTACDTFTFWKGQKAARKWAKEPTSLSERQVHFSCVDRVCMWTFIWRVTSSLVMPSSLATPTADCRAMFELHAIPTLLLFICAIIALTFASFPCHASKYMLKMWEI